MSTVKLAIFDLDNTLIAGDSDHAWGTFLVHSGVVSEDHYRRQNDRFYADYCAGTLDIHNYQRFVLTPLIALSQDERASLRAEFIASHIAPMRLPKAEELLAKHRRAGDQLLVITATNHFVAAPVVALLGIPNLLATEPEMVAGEFTGAIAGIPCYRQGKVQRLHQWLEEQQVTLASSHFYSDSINDVALLEEVDHPIAVDPDEQLRDYASRRRWPIISLR